jgi:hypothetical protein
MPTNAVMMTGTLIGGLSLAYLRSNSSGLGASPAIWTACLMATNAAASATKSVGSIWATVE